MRVKEAQKRGKATKYRKCYIGLKVTSVACYSDGECRDDYVPRKTHHLYDTALPQTGNNMFEDIDLDTEEAPEQTELRGRTTQAVKISGSSGTEKNRDWVNEGVNDMRSIAPKASARHHPVALRPAVQNYSSQEQLCLRPSTRKGKERAVESFDLENFIANELYVRGFEESKKRSGNRRGAN